MMTSMQEQPGSKRRIGSLMIRVALGALFIAYVIQLRSPLRINTDATTILRLTAILTDGKPYMLDGSRPIFPIGMPLTYSLMERAGIANSFGFGALNLACICVAGCATWMICNELRLRSIAPAIILISFSSFVLIKHSVLPLTDIPYMAISLLGVALLEILPRQRGRMKAGVFLMALCCVIGAILVRRVGIALVPAVLYAIRPSKRQMSSLKAFLLADKLRLFGVGGVLLGIIAGAALVFRRLLYLPDFHFGGSFGEAIVNQLSMRMTDFAELLINAPSAKLGRLYPLIFVAGAALTVLIFIGLWETRRKLHTMHIYFICYLAILSIWPFFDVRFWIPVLPLITITVVGAISHWSRFRFIHYLTTIYLGYYAILTIVAILYTTRITLAGGSFPEIYGSGSAREAYEHAWSGQAADAGDDKVAVIHRYGMEGAPR
jgi:hypothetical protein